MGCDLIAIFDVDQEEIEKFIVENNIDRNDWDKRKLVSEYYKSKYLTETPELYIYYFWNRNCKIHEIHSSYGTNFIRDDNRFNNKTYQRMLEKKYMKPYPKCLRNINWSLHTARDAVEIAEGLDTFFSEDDEDEDLMHFSKWLKQTAKCNCVYELSY